MRAVDSRFQMTIQKDFGDDVGAIKAVPQDLSRVFLNIVTNACQATFDKQLAEDSDPNYQPELEVTSRKDNGQIEVRIKDNGPGIPEETLKKIFEPFFTRRTRTRAPASAFPCATTSSGATAAPWRCTRKSGTAPIRHHVANGVERFGSRAGLKPRSAALQSAIAAPRAAKLPCFRGRVAVRQRV